MLVLHVSIVWLMDQLVCLEDFESEARKRLDRNAWVYYFLEAERGCTLRDNLEAFNR